MGSCTVKQHVTAQPGRGAQASSHLQPRICAEAMACATSRARRMLPAPLQQNFRWAHFSAPQARIKLHCDWLSCDDAKAQVAGVTSWDA